MTSLFVTALYDLATFENNDARKKIDVYLEHLKFLTIEQKNIDLIIFTEASLYEAISLQCAANTTSRIKIVVKEIRDLPLFSRLEKFMLNSVVHPYLTKTPTKDTSLYKIIQLSKIDFIKEAYDISCTIMNNQVDKFIWIDSGIQYVATSYEKNIDVKEVVSCFDDRHFYCTLINPLTNQEYSNLNECCTSWKYRQVGGFWSVGRNLVDHFVSDIYKDLNFILSQGYVTQDEDIMARFAHRNPHLCKFGFGDYRSCIVNWLPKRCYDMHVALKCIERCHDKGLHVMAIAGFEWQVNLMLSGALQLLPYQFFGLLKKWYIQTFYVDQQKAKELVFLACYLAHVNYEFKYLFEDEKNDWIYLMSHVGESAVVHMQPQFDTNNVMFQKIIAVYKTRDE